MKVLVCGGRDYTDREAFDRAMAQIAVQPSLVIEGGAVGADRMAREWARDRGIHVATVEALWDWYRRSAGPRRNEVMLSLQPALCVAFPGGTGTAGMVSLCQDAGIPVYAPYE